MLILRDVYDNESSGNYLYRSQLETMLADKYADGNAQYLALLIKGLQDFHLLGYGSAGIVIDGVNQWHMVSSDIAKEFFDYLSA